MRAAIESLPAEITIRESLERARTSKFRTWLVFDGAGSVAGVLNLSALEKAAAEFPDKQLRELVDPLNFPHVHSDHGLDLALERMGANQLDILPVVNRGNIHKLEGIVTLQDILNVFGISSPASA
jgi:CIC family chloride channel protein